jgi:signal transduction histidine kinase
VDFTLWLPIYISVLTAGIGFYAVISGRQRQTSQRRLQEAQWDLERRQMHREETELQRASDQAKRESGLLPAVLSDLPDQIARAVARELRAAPNVVNISLNPDSPYQSTDGDRDAGEVPSLDRSREDTTSATLMREIAHSLNTPLAHIEATVLLLQEDLGQSDDLIRIRESVRMCKSFVLAFRDLASVATTATSWSPSSLRESLELGSRVYAHQQNSSVEISVDLPDSISGYGNSLVAACILPLVENAIEAASPNGKVRVTLESNDDADLLHVNTTPVASSLTNEIYESGYTSKSDHEGLGLSTVRRLLSAYAGATITHKNEVEAVTFTVQLPNRRS